MEFAWLAMTARTATARSPSMSSRYPSVNCRASEDVGLFGWDSFNELSECVASSLSSWILCAAMGVAKDPQRPRAKIGDTARLDEGMMSVMAETYVVDQIARGRVRVNRAAARVYTFLVAGTASLIVTMSAYSEAMRATRACAFLAALIGLHLLWQPRIIWRREYTLYACFVGYMFVTLLWTRDLDLASNTLVPAMSFFLAMILFGSLINYHDVRTVLAGALCGFATGAAVYTLTQGFPLSYPVEFSYNAIANMYVFGLFVTLMYGSFRRSNGFVLLAIAVIIMLHIVATTSIKTNLGIALGLAATGVMFFGYFGKLIRRRLLTLIVLTCGLAIAIASNDALVEIISRGGQRVLIGVQVLQVRDDVAGYTGFEDRGYWEQQGIAGWSNNPVFGYGVEAFRNDYGTTSHSTPIDLLYNYGLIGLVLFYSVFASLIWRLLRLAGRRQSSQRSLILGGVVCYLFVTLSATMHYDILLASFVGISVALFAVHDRASNSALPVSNQTVGHPSLQ